MAGRRRFGLFVFIAIAFLLIFWYQPQRSPTVRPWVGYKYPTFDAPEDKQAEQYAFTTYLTTSTTEIAHEIASPIVHEIISTTHAALALETPFEHTSTNNLQQLHAQTTLAVQSITESLDPYAYLQSTSSPDPYAYLQESGSVKHMVEQETVIENAFAYLTVTTTVDEYQYLTASSTAIASQHTQSKPDTAVEDEYAYLTYTTTIDEYRYLTAASTPGASHHAQILQESAVENAFAYLTLSATIDEYHYLTASSTAASHAQNTDTKHHSQSTHTTHDAAALPSSGSGDPNLYDPKEFGGDKWFFEEKLNDYPNPKFNIDKMKSFAPHNYKGAGHETYATFLSTRNSSLQDPYFLATQQVAYRLLWDPRSKSKQHPFTVFVAPYIPQIQRDYLLAAGAMVRELELIEWHPSHATTASPRWREMFSKLNFWKQTDFSRILYLDTDAFPLTNMDELFTTAEKQDCDPNELDSEDQVSLSEICDYVFTAVPGEDGEINAGMMIFKPNMAMHTRLLRESTETDKFDQNMVEQAFITYAFREDGPFPVHFVDRKWNALFTDNDDEGKINVIHEKLWAMLWRDDHFAAGYFRETWTAMQKLYESTEFLSLRTADGLA